MEKGNIIILDGASGSGKAALSKALQNVFEQPYIRLSIDEFIGMMPEMEPDRNMNNTVMRGRILMLDTIKLLSNVGIHVVVDDVMLKDYQTIRQYTAELHHYPVLLVRVNSPGEELPGRGAEEDGRSNGQKDSPMCTPEAFEQYDLTVDPFLDTTEECIDLIKKRMASGEPSVINRAGK